MIRDRQADYYRVLGACDKVGNSTAFIEFLLDALLTALREASATDQVKSLLKTLKTKPLSAVECMQRLKLSAFDAVFHAVAGAFEHNGVAVVEEAVEHGGGDGGVTVEDGGPLLEGFVGGQDDGAALVAGADNLEE